MKHNTRTYFIERVLRSYETFVDYYNGREFGLRTDTFNAGNIAEALRDIPEHIFIEIGTGTGFDNANQFRESISDKYKYYKIICDLANVIKHKEINRKSPTFSSLDAVKESIASVRYDDIFGKYYKTRKLLEVTLSDNTVYEIGELLRESVLLWSNQLISFGIITKMLKLPELLPKFVKRKDQRFDSEIIIKGYVGEYMEQQFRALTYNKSKNLITELTSKKKFGKCQIPIKMKIEKSPFLEDENKILDPK